MEKLKFGFEDMDLYQKAREFKNEIRKLTMSFPREEKYRLVDQVIRSSRSITSLISEGHGRYTYSDQLHFYIQARGSLSETINHLIHAFDEGFITAETLFQLKEKGKLIEKQLNGFITYLRKKKENST